MLSLVTGAAGFVGQALVRRLLDEGDRVQAVALPGERRLPELHALAAGTDRLQIIEADVTDFTAVAPAFAGVARAFHTAAFVHGWAPRARFRVVNVGGTQHVARAAHEHGVGRFVHVSTSDVFGIPRGDEVLDETCPLRAWGEPYPDTKIKAEQWLWQFHRDTGLPLSVIYPGWVYGPGDQAFFPGLADAIAGGQMVFWCRDVRLAWAYVDNLVDACLLASTHPAAVGNGYLVYDTLEGPTLQEVCARIAATIGATAPTRHVPYAVAHAAAALAQWLWRRVGLKSAPFLLTSDVKAFGRQWHFSNEKARTQLGWTPRISTDEGMAAALDYLRRRRVQRG